MTKKMKIGTRILLNVFIMLTLLIGIIGFALYAFNKFDAGIKEFALRTHQLEDTMMYVNSISELSFLGMDLIVAKNEGITTERRNKFNKLKNECLQHQKELNANADTDDEKEDAKTIDILMSEYLKIIENELFVAIDKTANKKWLTPAEETAEFARLDNVLDKKSNDVKDKINNVVKSIDAEVSTASNNGKIGDIDLTFIVTVFVILAIVSLVVGISVGLLVTRSISKILTRTIESLTDSSVQVSSGSQQVAEASQRLAEGSSEQASSIEEMSASFEEMSAMIQKNTENAVEASKNVEQTGKIVDKANISMSELKKSIEVITKTSEETNKIIKVIDEIAFQTNLLALNAAVEAARAGEAGMGFAVVADEVRNLAQRSAEAAKDTANLIDTSIKNINEGYNLTKATEADFNEVVKIIEKLIELINEVAVASKEQAQGIEQINVAVNEIDKITQLNASSSEETASASEEMNAQANAMMEIINDLVALVGGKSIVYMKEQESRLKSKSKAHHMGDAIHFNHMKKDTGHNKVGIAPRQDTSPNMPSNKKNIKHDDFPMDDDINDNNFKNF